VLFLPLFLLDRHSTSSEDHALAEMALLTTLKNVTQIQLAVLRIVFFNQSERFAIQLRISAWHLLSAADKMITALPLVWLLYVIVLSLTMDLVASMLDAIITVIALPAEVLLLVVGVVPLALACKEIRLQELSAQTRIFNQSLAFVIQAARMEESALAVLAFALERILELIVA
jgi:hypothetical protein